jgi:O-methyltransferase
MKVRAVVRRLAPQREPDVPEPDVDALEGFPQPHVVSQISPEDREILTEVRARRLSMVSGERLLATIDAVRYVLHRDIPGALVECGVWRGGNVLAMVRALQQAGVDDREVFLYDTFEGMTSPGKADVSRFEPPAVETWNEAQSGDRPWAWAFGQEIYGLEFVQDVILGSGYPPDRIHFVQGPVEQTIPATVPEKIAVLRLDTDWYESTMHELRHLYPKIPTGGVFICDDYGHWEGACRAVDEYFSTVERPLLLTRTDYTGRMAVKS